MPKFDLLFEQIGGEVEKYAEASFEIGGDVPEDIDFKKKFVIKVTVCSGPLKGCSVIFLNAHVGDNSIFAYLKVSDIYISVLGSTTYDQKSSAEFLKLLPWNEVYVVFTLAQS
jgi:hypothetical protein